MGVQQTRRDGDNEDKIVVRSSFVLCVPYLARRPRYLLRETPGNAPCTQLCAAAAVHPGE